MIRNLTFVMLAVGLTTVSVAAPQHSPWPGGVGIVHIPGEARPSVIVDDQQALILWADNWRPVRWTP